jgi:GNAT superfamily N-acetyltransferase
VIEDLIFEPLEYYHNRAAFTCSGDEGLILQEYLRNDGRALREHKRNVTTAWIMVRESEPHTICGFFTLSTATLEIEELPKNVRRGLPLYRPMPALKLGRMAVDDRFRGQDFGTILTEEAFSICLRLRQSVGFVALLVDAKSDSLVEYYEQRGFSRFPDQPRSLYIMQPTMAQIIAGK